MSDSRWTWTRDPERGCWDGECSDGRTACVAKDAFGKTPWAAWHSRLSKPDSWHRTMREAKKACEEARDGS